MAGPRVFFRPLDAIVAALIAAAAVWGFTAFRLAPAGRAVVYVGNAKFGWYDLQGAPRQVEVPTAIGTVTLQVGGGGARVLRSPCPNRLCVKRGTVRRAHGELICMPARLLVVLEGGEGGDAREPQPDAVTY